MCSYIICSYKKKHVFDKGYCSFRSVVMLLTILCVCDDSLVFIYTLSSLHHQTVLRISYRTDSLIRKIKLVINETFTKETILWRSKLLTMEVLHSLYDTITTKETY